MKKALSVAALAACADGLGFGGRSSQLQGAAAAAAAAAAAVDRLLRRSERGRDVVGQQYVWTSSRPDFLLPRSGAARLSTCRAFPLGGFGRSQGNTGGFIGGGQIGYNWQFYNSFVAGVEADIQGIAGGNSHETSVTAAPVAFPFIGQTKSLRPRSRPRSASTISARCAAASAGCSRRPCSFTAPAVSPMAASPCRPASRSSIE